MYHYVITVCAGKFINFASWNVWYHVRKITSFNGIISWSHNGPTVNDIYPFLSRLRWTENWQYKPQDHWQEMRVTQVHRYIMTAAWWTRHKWSTAHVVDIGLEPQTSHVRRDLITEQQLAQRWVSEWVSPSVGPGASTYRPQLRPLVYRDDASSTPATVAKTKTMVRN